MCGEMQLFWNADLIPPVLGICEIWPHICLWLHSKYTLETAKVTVSAANSTARELKHTSVLSPSYQTV